MDYRERYERLQKALKRNKVEFAHEIKDFSDITWEEFTTFTQVKEKPFKTFLNPYGIGYYIDDKGEKKTAQLQDLGRFGIIAGAYPLNRTPQPLYWTMRGNKEAPRGYTFQEPEAEDLRLPAIEPTSEDEEEKRARLEEERVGPMKYYSKIDGTDYYRNEKFLVIDKDRNFVGTWSLNGEIVKGMPTLETISDFNEVLIRGDIMGINRYGDVVNDEGKWVGRAKVEKGKVVNLEKRKPWYLKAYEREKEPDYLWRVNRKTFLKDEIPML